MFVCVCIYDPDLLLYLTKTICMAGIETRFVPDSGVRRLAQEAGRAHSSGADGGPHGPQLPRQPAGLPRGHLLSGTHGAVQRQFRLSGQGPVI